MKVEKVDTVFLRNILFKGLLSTLLLWVIGFAVGRAHGSDVQWSRLKGTVKGINQKTAALTIQNPGGDLLTLKVDEDVTIWEGKEAHPLKDVRLDDRVVLIYEPKAPKPKEPDEPAPGGVYPKL